MPSKKEKVNREISKRKYADDGNREMVLLKDIVIPRGTVFKRAPERIEMNEDHFEAIIGLSDNTAGSLIYAIDEFEELNEFFTDLKGR